MDHCRSAATALPAGALAGQAVPFDHRSFATHSSILAVPAAETALGLSDDKSAAWTIEHALPPTRSPRPPLFAVSIHVHPFRGASPARSSATTAFPLKQT